VSGFSRTVTLAGHVRDAVVAHAREAAPHECCGLLLGRGGEIVEAVRARNIADDPATRFLVDPKDHFDGMRAARERGLDVVGFYHSHPHSPAEPSETDLAELSYPDHLYVIVSLRAAAPEIGLFRLERGNFQRLPFVTVG
jgi:proteasome lid subunit RPN8/RPN11